MDLKNPPYSAEDHLKLVFDSIKDYAIFTVDLNNHITSWNSGAERVLGWTETEAVGQPGAMIFTPEDRAKGEPEKELRIALEQGAAEDKRWHIRRDGSRFYASGMLRQMRDADGNLRGFIKVARDATAEYERRQAEEKLLMNESRLTAIFTQAEVGLSEISFEGRFLRVNDFLCRMIKRSEEEMLTLSVADVTHPEDIAPSLKALNHLIVTGEPVSLDKRYLQPDGTHIWANSSVSRLNDTLLAVTVDLSERKKNEAQIRELTTMQERQHFARDLHDAISQTLFTASLMSDAVTRMWEMSPQDIPELLTDINNLVKGALADLRMIILQLRSDTIEVIPFTELLKQLIMMLKNRKEVEVTLDFEGEPVLPPTVHMTLFRIAQESFNNIMKHSQASEIHVMGQGGTGKVALVIRDNGIGFNRKLTPLNGLGLQMMEERAHEIGAQVDVRSTLGKGTEVIVRWEEVSG